MTTSEYGRTTTEIENWSDCEGMENKGLNTLTTIRICEMRQKKNGIFMMCCLMDYIGNPWMKF